MTDIYYIPPMHQCNNSCCCKKWSRKYYPSKNSNKNSIRGSMKKCFYTIFQMYIQNKMIRLNFKMAPFCFYHESETGLHRSSRTPHHLFVQLGPSWLNCCLQWVRIGVGTSCNIPFQNSLLAKSMTLTSGLEGGHICLSQKHQKLSLHALLGHIRWVSWSTVLCDGVISLKNFCEPRKNLGVDFHAFIIKYHRRLDSIWCNISPNHNASKFLESKMTSDVDR